MNKSYENAKDTEQSESSEREKTRGLIPSDFKNHKVIQPDM